MADEQPRIIVDSDWKAEAQAEKERLAQQERKAQPAAGELPPATFEELVRLMASQALMYMGGYPDPQTGKAMVSLELARLHIDLLDVLAHKTKGNLTDDEDRMLSGILSQLRMEFVDLSKALAQAIREGKVTTVAAPGAPAEPQPPPAGDRPPTGA